MRFGSLLDPFWVGRRANHFRPGLSLTRPRRTPPRALFDRPKVTAMSTLATSLLRHRLAHAPVPPGCRCRGPFPPPDRHPEGTLDAIAAPPHSTRRSG